MPKNPDDNKDKPLDHKKPVYIALVKEGKLKKEKLDYDEALKTGILHSNAYLLIDSDDPLPKSIVGMVCEHDHYSQKDLESTGRLGCPKCYVTFEKMLIPLLTKMHKSIKHCGKTPRKHRNEQMLHNRLEHLQKELDSAIRSERYEDAASVRDKINKAKSEKK